MAITATVYCYEIQNVTENTGLLPINLGPAKLHTHDHTFVHYYDLTEIKGVYLDLQHQYYLMLHNVNLLYSAHNYQGNLLEYCKIINFTINAIDDKISYLYPYKYNRTRRGLINGLGSLIKIITGNLDSNDEKRYDAIIKHLQENEQNIQNQINMEYSISTNLIVEYNKTLTDIQYNNNMLKSRINEISSSLTNLSIAQKIRENFSQLQDLLEIILNVFQDIENSLTFCKIGTLHPSIISSLQLFNEIKRIAIYYKGSLPFPVDLSIISEYENIVSINCKVVSNRIIYFISLPLTDGNNYDLYNLYSIPFKNNDKFLTVIPSADFILKSNNSNLKFIKKCKRSRINICPNELLLHRESPCETNIVIHQSPANCTFTKVNIPSNFIERVPKTSHYIAVFPFMDTIKIENDETTTSHTLQGVFLISIPDATLRYKTMKISKPSESHGRPFILKNFKLGDIQDSTQLNATLELRSLTFHNLPTNIIVPNPIPLEDYPSLAHSILIIILYILLFVIVILITMKYLKVYCLTKKPVGKRDVSTRQRTDLPEIHLPKTASI